MEKHIGHDLIASITEDAWPHFVTIRNTITNDEISLSHEQSRDLLYAMTRFVAMIDKWEN